MSEEKGRCEMVIGGAYIWLLSTARGKRTTRLVKRHQRTCEVRLVCWLVTANNLSFVSYCRKFIAKSEKVVVDSKEPVTWLGSASKKEVLLGGGGRWGRGGAVRGPTKTFGQKSTTFYFCFHSIQKPSKRVKTQYNLLICVLCPVLDWVFGWLWLCFLTWPN